jgi:outer membrane protein TolC
VALLVSATLPGIAHAQSSHELTLSMFEAFDYAAEHSPVAGEAEARVELADARIVDASISTHQDPVVEVAAGPRFGASTTTPNVAVTVGQRFELSRRRQAAMKLAERGRAVVEYEAADIRRQLYLLVGRAYVDVLHARRRLDVSRSDTEITARAFETASRRFEAGETDRLEVNTAKVAHGRALIDEQLWSGRLDERRADLRRLLGVPERTRVVLDSSLERPELPSLPTLMEAAEQRADVRALRETLKREQAREALASTLVHPDLGVRFRYAREEGADILMAALAVSLPVFPRGKGLRAEAAGRTEMTNESLRRTRIEVEELLPAAHSRWQRLRTAEVSFRNDVLPLVEGNEEMARKAYAAGAIDLPELLALRREIVAARERYVDLLRESAMVELEVRSLAGLLGEKGETR